MNINNNSTKDNKNYLYQVIRIKPDKYQKAIFDAYFGYSRYCYNQGLDLWNRMYENYKETKDKKDKPNFFNVRNSLVKQKADWEKEYSSQVLKSAIENLSNGFDLFFKGVAKHPKFKSKNKSKNSFRYDRETDQTIQIVNQKYLKLAKFDRPIKMYESIRFEGIIKQVTISQKGNKYFASFNIQVDSETILRHYHKTKSNDYCGVDLGVKTLAVINDSKNNTYEADSIIRTALIPLWKKIKRYSRILSRKTKDSNNYLKAKTKLSGYYLRKHSVQIDYIHNLTTFLCKNYKYITIEDLKPRNMVKNKKISRQIAESMFYEIRRQLTYKSMLYGNNLIVADMWFPSTQLCSHCGNVLTKENKLSLNDRTYVCPRCNSNIDRDENAAINLKLYGMRYVGRATSI